MKVVLVILCAISILFAGGCMIAVSGEAATGDLLTPMLFAALCFNAIFIWAALSKEPVAAWALVVCAVVDIGLDIWLTQFFGDFYVGPVVWIPFSFFAVKALLGAWLGYRRLTTPKG